MDPSELEMVTSSLRAAIRRKCFPENTLRFRNLLIPAISHAACHPEIPPFPEL